MSDSYEAELAASGLEDVQPRYRALLMRLRQNDPRRYERAVARYRADVEANSSGNGALRAWLAYGGWLAELVEPGRLVAVSSEGRAADAAPEPPPAGTMLLHLPSATNRKGWVVAMPAAATEAQRATADLLCD